MKRQPGEFQHLCRYCRQLFRDFKRGAYGDIPVCPRCWDKMTPAAQKDLKRKESISKRRAKGETVSAEDKVFLTQPIKEDA